MREQKRQTSRVPSKDSKRVRIGLVGIIFLVGRDRLLIESSQISEAETCAGFVNHRRGHDEFWAELQMHNLVPRDEEYISIPRGRVIFSVQEDKYSLLLDRCILKKPKIVQEIRERMNLPSRRLLISTDGHYRCAYCMGKTSL